MSRKSKRDKLIISDEQKDLLIKLSQSRTLPFQKIQRSKILLKYADGIELSTIFKELKTTRVILKAFSPDNVDRYLDPMDYYIKEADKGRDYILHGAPALIGLAFEGDI